MSIELFITQVMIGFALARDHSCAVRFSLDCTILPPPEKSANQLKGVIAAKLATAFSPISWAVSIKPRLKNADWA